MNNGSKPEWRKLGYSQGIQEVTDRIYNSYNAFFKWIKDGKPKDAKRLPPKFKKFRKYKSFTLKQTGWKLDQENEIIKIGKNKFRYNKSRDIQGKPKTVTIKRNSIGDWYIFIACDLGDNFKPNKVKAMTGKIAGFDFGLKTFLTSSENKQYLSGEFLKSNIGEIKRCNKDLSRKVKGSNNRRKSRYKLARKHLKIARKRKDSFFKLANNLLEQYDYLFFEDLDLESMRKRWGRKVSDYSFYSFIQILKNAGFK
jgi:putative transposase